MPLARATPSATIRCRLCASPDTAPWRRKRGFTLDRCRACGGAFLPDAAVPRDLESLYAPAYFAGGNATGYPSYLADAPLLERNFARRLAWIEKLGPPGRRLLDVGTAYGLCLKVARARGWEAIGVEIAPECARTAALLASAPVVAGDFLAADLTGPFDVVTMFDVLEHFREPRAAITRAGALLAPGGLLVIETGDLASPWARLLGRSWYFLDPPQHLSYPTATGLRALLSALGFTDVRLARPGRSVGLANVAFKLAHHAPGAPLRALAGWLSRQRLRASVYVNFGDGMMLAAVRTAVP